MNSDPSGYYAVGKKIAASVFNFLIGLVVGKGVSAVQKFILRKGKEEAKRIFTRTIVSRLKAWGLTKLGWTVAAAVDVACDYYSMGQIIADFIDAHDTYKYNGWLG